MKEKIVEKGQDLREKAQDSIQKMKEKTKDEWNNQERMD